MIEMKQNIEKKSPIIGNTLDLGRLQTLSDLRKLLLVDKRNACTCTQMKESPSKCT